MNPTTSIVMVIAYAVSTSALPIVDPGLFVISGVKTCGDGEGYCLLGSDCSLDKDFIEDRTGHCGGLRGAFTPSAHFICCSDSKKENEVEENLVKNKFSKYPPDIESDMNTTDIETTTFAIVKDYIALESGSVISNSESDVMCDTVHTCDSTVTFLMEGSQLCWGSHVGTGWVVTTALCAMKIFRVGMRSVAVNFMNDPDILESFVKTIIVHESYRPSTTNLLLPEANNLGLIQLNDTTTSNCTLCLPKSGQSFAGHVCKTLSNSNSSDSNHFCEAEVENMQGAAKEEFLSLACYEKMQSNYQNGESQNGKPLICGGYLSGMETTAGVGTTIFTQLSLYSEWLKSNMEPKPTQYFRTF